MISVKAPLLVSFRLLDFRVRAIRRLSIFPTKIDQSGAIQTRIFFLLNIHPNHLKYFFVERNQDDITDIPLML